MIGISILTWQSLPLILLFKHPLGGLFSKLWIYASHAYLVRRDGRERIRWSYEQATLGSKDFGPSCIRMDEAVL